MLMQWRMGGIAAEVDSGKDGNSRWMANFAPQQAAANTVTAAIVA